MPQELKPMQMNFYSYGLGFNLQDYRGYKLVTHTGGLPGYLSRLALIPDLKLGVTVLTNQESGAAFNAIAFYVLDYYLGVDPHDWLISWKIVADRQKERYDEAEAKALTERNKITSPSLELKNYAGSYRDIWYGDIEIRHANDDLEIRFAQTPDLTGRLEHWQYDTFVARWYDRSLRGDAFVTFSFNPDGSIDQVKMKPFSPAVDFSFDYQDLLLKPVREDIPKN
jgi:hypothetical protein